jgi:alkylhydroperoxidase family enzyme
MREPRIPKADVTGLSGALAKMFTKRKLGQVPDALGVMWHNQPVLKAFFGIGGKADRWDACEPNLKTFAHMAVSSLVGCGFCLDLAYFEAYNKKLDVDKAREVPRWRASTAFTPLERDVMEYAEAMTHTPPTVTDELSARLLDALGAPALVELTAYIAMANLYTRANTAFAIESHGFAASCELRPLADPATTARDVPAVA